MPHDPPEGVVWFTNRTDKIAYKMPHKIEQYNSLSDLEREHTKSVYLRNEEDKRRGVEYVMSKILGFFKECLELGPKYVTGIADEGEVIYGDPRASETSALAIVQNHLTKIKRPSLDVLGAIAKMTSKTKPTMKLVSWLNRQMR
ncbi:hypothetical protein Tco_0331247 [Tanacetum coccineum]